LFAPLRQPARLSIIGPGAALTVACPYTFALSAAWTRTRGGPIKMNPPRTRTVQRAGGFNMPSNLIEWTIFIGAGIALGLVLFLGLSA
jgi:hypothetical protein